LRDVASQVDLPRQKRGGFHQSTVSHDGVSAEGCGRIYSEGQPLSRYTFGIMKTPTLLVTVALALAATSCKPNPTPPIPVPEARAADPIPTPPPAAIPIAIASRLLEQGQAISAQAFGALSTRLGKAIAGAGYTHAIEFCSVHGIPLTTSVGVTNRVTLRRVTHRPRNPGNRADTNELAILQQYQRELAQGSKPKPVITAHKPDAYTYYAPIVLNLPLCLNCHGEAGTDIKPEVLAQIRKTYPADEATGFKSGDLRGLWSIDFPRADFVERP